MSYLINMKGDELIAKTTADYLSGDLVEYSRTRITEEINADREYNLVNARNAKISNAKKWEKKADFADTAVEINLGEFYIY